MIRIFLVSSLIGLLASLAGWAATFIVMGQDDVFVLRGRLVEWNTALIVLTVLSLLAMLVAMFGTVEPIMTTLATAAGCALLFNTRDMPFLRSTRNLSRVENHYWSVVVAVTVIFAVLLVGLRMIRESDH